MSEYEEYIVDDGYEPGSDGAEAGTADFDEGLGSDEPDNSDDGGQDPRDSDESDGEDDFSIDEDDAEERIDEGNEEGWGGDPIGLFDSDDPAWGADLPEAAPQGQWDAVPDSDDVDAGDDGEGESVADGAGAIWLAVVGVVLVCLALLLLGYAGR